MRSHDTTHDTPKLCACGCGQPVAKPTNRFVHNHHGRRAPHGADPVKFWAKVSVAGPDDCWLWNGFIAPNGYGQFWNGSQADGSHRIAYILTYGPIPDGQVIAHTCDVKRCCNPAHLVAGSQQENIADMFAKNRQNRAKGERHGLARFTNEQARALRLQFSKLNISVLAFAKMHNVPDETMRRLINRETYRTV